MRFVNLHTGNVYDGSKPYVHWFEGQQSTDLIYIQPICFITSSNTPIVRCRSDVFSIIDVTKLMSTSPDFEINNFEYKDISACKTNEFAFREADVSRFKIGYKLTDGAYINKYMYIVYFMASSPVAAEYIDSFWIGDEEFLIGADFYQENESLRINASNMGMNIPPQIQGAVYDSNVHEEKHDNILINRKFKELVSNYWDLIANRGSYKSLINTLKWFEYGDVVRLREIWKHSRDGVDVYDDRELSSIMSDKYKTSLNKFFKTTYFAIWCALQKETGKFTKELNPELEKCVFKWSVEDMSLKMSLLGNFYETYFMPIHTELIQSSIEDVVFTNTIKINNRVLDSIDDLMNLNKSFRCTVNDNKEVVIGDVSVGVDDSTLFGIKYGNEQFAGYDTTPVGVKSIDNINEIHDNSELMTLLTQNYNGPGAMVPIECSFDLGDNERISYGDILINSEDSYGEGSYGNKYERYARESGVIDSVVGDKHIIKFNVLLLHTTNVIHLHFISTRGNHYSKTINVPMKDISNVVIGLYKVKRNVTGTTAITPEDFSDPVNLFTASRIKLQSGSNELIKYTQYMSFHVPENTKEPKDGVGMNHVVALNDGWERAVDAKCRNILESYYMEFDKGVRTMFVSNFFIDSLPIKKPEIGPIRPMSDIKASPINPNTPNIPNIPNIPSGPIEAEILTIKEDLDYLWGKLKKYIYFYRSIYFPELHHLEPFGSFVNSTPDPNNFTITQYDTLFVSPSLMLPGVDEKGLNTWVTYLYGKDIEKASWEFRNRSLNESYIIEPSSLEPYVLPTRNEELKDGYYDVVFRYKLKSDKNSEHELVLNSAFMKKKVFRGI